MTITLNDDETFTYKKNNYKYGELSLIFLNYILQKTHENANFINDFNIKTNEESKKKLADLFKTVYEKCLLCIAQSIKKRALENEKVKKILQTPYKVKIKYSISEDSIFLTFPSLQDFLLYDYFGFFFGKNYISTCEGCGKYMLAHTLGRSAFCSTRCCAIYNNMVYTEKVSNSPILKEYYKLHNKYYRRVERDPKKYPLKTFYSWNDKALELKKASKVNKEMLNEFEEFLKIDPFKQE